MKGNPPTDSSPGGIGLTPHPMSVLAVEHTVSVCLDMDKQP